MRRSTRFDAAAALALLALAAACGDPVRVDADRPDGDFTTAEGENHIMLRARLRSAWRSADVRWHVERGLAGDWSEVSVDPGAETVLTVTTPKSTARYRGSHPRTDSLREERLDRQRIRYRIVATARRAAEEVTSDTLELVQSEVASIRQEYLDIGLRRGAPPAAWFRAVDQLPPGANGDHDLGVANPEFLGLLERLEGIWVRDYELQWQVNSFFRNPVHNRYHIGGSGSGPVSNSWHQFGCAIDLQTFPVLRRGSSPRSDSLEAMAFWNALAQEALLLDLEVEPRDKNPNRPSSSYSGVGHVHLEKDCPP